MRPEPGDHMIIYVKLEEGDVMQKGDEIIYNHPGAEWHAIPESWWGQKLSYKDNNTLSRQKIPVRRSLKLVGNDIGGYHLFE